MNVIPCTSKLEKRVTVIKAEVTGKCKKKRNPETELSGLTWELDGTRVAQNGRLSTMKLTGRSAGILTAERNCPKE